MRFYNFSRQNQQREIAAKTLKPSTAGGKFKKAPPAGGRILTFQEIKRRKADKR